MPQHPPVNTLTTTPPHPPRWSEGGGLDPPTPVGGGHGRNTHSGSARISAGCGPGPCRLRSMVITAKSGVAQRLLAALNEELTASSKRSGRELVWSAAEMDVLGMICAAVDRRVELTAAYEECESTATKLKIATELRLT